MKEKSKGCFLCSRAATQALRLSVVRCDLVWKLPGEAKLFISMEWSVGGWFAMLPAHSAVVWATNCTGRKTLCNHPAIVYSGRVTTATGFRDWVEEPALFGGRKSVVDNSGWLQMVCVIVCSQIWILQGFPRLVFSSPNPFQVFFLIIITNNIATDTISFWLAKL